MGAAQRALDNPDLQDLFNARKKELQDDVLLSSDEKEILEAHTEHQNLIGFSEWINHVASHEGEV